MSAQSSTDLLPSGLQCLHEPVAAIFDQLHALVSTTLAQWQTLASHGPLHRQQTDALQPAIHAALHQLPQCAGVGLVFAPGALSDCRLHMQWWRRDAEGNPAMLQLNCNEDSPNCYHYEQRGWFSVPRDQDIPVVDGPYVDPHCTGAYALTFSLPVRLAGQFIGVAAADVPLHDIEPLLARCLMQLPQDALLLTASGRVIASNTPDWSAGDLASRLLEQPQPQRETLPLSGWVLVYPQATSPR